MPASRLDIALADHPALLPDRGEIGVIRARATESYAALPPERLHLFNSFRPEFDALTARGFDTAAAPDPGDGFALNIIHVTRSKAETLGLIARALIDAPVGGLVLVEGGRTDGIDSVMKRCRNMIPLAGAFSKAHGRVFWMTRPGALPDPLRAWAGALEPRRNDAGFFTAPGMFSPEHADPGSRFLAGLFDDRLRGRVADLGAGWGWLAAQALERTGVAQVDLVEAEKTALDAARLSLTGGKAAFHWRDVRTFTPDAPYDAVICNPPFHTTREADPGLGTAFIAKAAEILKPGGSLWLVANRHLPYEASLEQQFRHFKPLAESPAFKAILATGARAKPMHKSRRIARNEPPVGER